MRALGRLFLALILAAATLGSAASATASPHAHAGVSSPNVPADFNGDGYDDLAVGVPGEELDSVIDAGAVNVIYGSANGLTSSGNQVWDQNSSGILDTAEPYDSFGAALAWGDFDQDGYGDLAVGIPGEDVGSVQDAGAVSVLYGSSAGLTSRDQLWTQNSTGIADTSETGDALGSEMAVGDFDGDHYDDLAVGVPDEDIGTVSDAGAVTIIYGSPLGLDYGPAYGGQGGSQFWSQNSSGIADAAESLDHFGSALAAGNFNGYEDDLAVGSPSESIGSVGGAGAVNVIYGSSSGLTATGNQFWSQNSSGIADASESEDAFGNSLVACNFGNDVSDDLAVGATRESLGSISFAGAVNVIYGSSSGLTSTGNQFWTQNSSGIADTAESGDEYGGRLTGSKLDGDGYCDLAVGARDESVGSETQSGAVSVIYGLATGLTSTGNQFWSQDTPGIADSPEPSDWFGAALTAGNFGVSWYSDLAMGVPRENADSSGDAGAVQVIYGTSSGLNSSGSQFWNQDSPGILGTAEGPDNFGASLA